MLLLKTTAQEIFDELGGSDEPEALERLRLRFFCSLAMNAKDWLDVEKFFDDVEKSLK